MYVRTSFTYKILQYLVEPSKSCKNVVETTLQNLSNTVNLCAAEKTESLFSLVKIQSYLTLRQEKEEKSIFLHYVHSDMCSDLT